MRKKIHNNLEEELTIEEATRNIKKTTIIKETTMKVKKIIKIITITDIKTNKIIKMIKTMINNMNQFRINKIKVKYLMKLNKRLNKLINCPQSLNKEKKSNKFPHKSKNSQK